MPEWGWGIGTCLPACVLEGLGSSCFSPVVASAWVLLPRLGLLAGMALFSKVVKFDKTLLCEIFSFSFLKFEFIKKLKLIQIFMETYVAPLQNIV